MFELIKNLRPYFHSLREFNTSMSLDLKIPVKWQYETIVSIYKSIIVKIQDKNDRMVLLSLSSTATQEGYDITFLCANEIIQKNKEIEEKQRLFQEKIKELEKLFQSESLDKLKELNFVHEQDYTDSISMAGGGEEERRGADYEPQKEDN